MKPIVIERLIRIEAVEPSDRNIVMIFENDKLVGLNYWQGLNDLTVMNNYTQSDKDLYEFVERKFKSCNHKDLFPYIHEHRDMKGIYSSSDYFDILNWIDINIWTYQDTKNKINELESHLKILNNILYEITY